MRNRFERSRPAEGKINRSVNRKLTSTEQFLLYTWLAPDSDEATDGTILANLLELHIRAHAVRLRLRRTRIG